MAESIVKIDGNLWDNFRLQDVINALKKEYVQLEENTRIEIQKLTDQVVKIHKNILELTIKSNHFTSINDKKYLQIWDMNARNADLLLNRVSIIFFADIAITKDNNVSDFKYG